MSSVSNTVFRGLMVALALTGCKDSGSDDDGDEVGGGPGIGSISVTAPATESGTGAATEATSNGPGGTATDNPPGDTGDTGDDSNASNGPKFDLGDPPVTTGPVDTGDIDCKADPMNPECMCTIPDHVPCDNGTQNLFNAMGLNCPGELQVNATTFGNVGAMGVRSNFGQAGIYNAREGSQFAVLGSGLVSDLNLVTPNGDSNLGPTHCNDSLPGNNDIGNPMPPIKINQVGGDCTQNPGLIGTGDCSNTLQAQFQAGGAAFDYAELRFTLQVPPDVTSFSYDFAFFSVEYPDYYQSQYNDMYIGWLESEQWTGNISFDQNGNPISLNAGFLEFKDDGGNLAVFGGTCMRQHAGTNWLQTTAGVTPGEQITVVFAIFDLADPILDSYIFLDNFKWGCEPTGNKPMTMPPG